MNTEYGYNVTLDASYEEAMERVTAALKSQGFGVLTEINVKETLKKKIDVDFQKYSILGACNPPLAHQALQADLEVGLLLPCNVIVFENEHREGTTVSIVNPMAMMQGSSNANLAAVAEEADRRLRRVIESL